jgi:hypothetical protein
MVLLVVGMVSMRNGPEQGAASPRVFPAQFVAVVEGALVVLDADDGSIERTLAVGEYEPPDFLEIQYLSIASGAEEVYFERGSRTGCENPIVKVPVGGGDEELVTRGYEPEVSPDGRSLAYVALAAPELCPDNILAISFELVVRDLDSGSERRWASPTGPPFFLGWAPDSRLLGYNFGDSAAWLLDTHSEPGELGPPNSSPVALPAPSARPVGLTPEGHLVTWDGATGQVRTSDAITGQWLADLFTLPTDIAPLGNIDTDPTGNSIVMATELKDVDSHPVLRKWTRGQRVPTVLDPSGRSPVWLP